MKARRDRLRKTAIICLHFLRNSAFYTAASEIEEPWVKHQFWIAVHNNFLDIAVLEWCKVFGDHRAHHHWRKSISENKQDQFRKDLFDHLSLTEKRFDEYINEMKIYRDKFVAHLDEVNKIKIPDMTSAINSVQLLYQWLIEHEDDCDAFPKNVPKCSISFYKENLDRGRSIYSAMHDEYRGIFLQKIESIYQCLKIENDIAQARNDMINLIKDILSRLGPEIGVWEKDCIINAIDALNKNIHQNSQPTDSWLRLCLTCIEQSLGPPYMSSEIYTQTNNDRNNMTYQQLLDVTEDLAQLAMGSEKPQHG